MTPFCKISKKDIVYVPSPHLTLPPHILENLDLGVRFDFLLRSFFYGIHNRVDSNVSWQNIRRAGFTGIHSIIDTTNFPPATRTHTQMTPLTLYPFLFTFMSLLFLYSL